MYHASGTGVEQDLVEAMKWLIISSANGDKRAADQLAALEKTHPAAEVQEARQKAAAWKPKEPGTP